MNEFSFSRRTDWSLDENPITQAVKSSRQKHSPFFDLTQSNPTQCGFDYPKEILQSFNKQQNLEYHPESSGIKEAKQAVVDYYAKRNIKLNLDHIFLTASTSEGYSYLFRLLADYQQEVLFPRPSYPLFQFLSDLNDVQMKFYALQNENWKIDFTDLENNISPQTKAVALVNPNNPTGSYLTQDELFKLNNICKQKNLAIISDEVFFDFPIEGNSDQTSLVNNQEVLSFVLGGLSKTLGMPQMKLGWIILSGPRDLIEQASLRLEVIADTYLSVNTPVQNAVSDWIEQADIIQDQIKKRIKDNYDVLKGQVLSIENCSLYSTQGGWYAIVKLPDIMSEEQWCLQFLDQSGVFVHPGYFFDLTDDPCVVISLLPQKNTFLEGINRLLGQVKSGSLKS